MENKDTFQNHKKKNNNNFQTLGTASLICNQKSFKNFYYRFQKVRHSPKLWKTEDRLVRWIRIAFASLLSFNVGFSISNAVLDLGLSPLYNNCFHEKDENMTKNYVMATIIMMPLVLLLLASAFLDLFLLLPMKTLTQEMPNQVEQQNTIDKIVANVPIRFSLLNTLFLVPYIVIFAVLSHIEVESYEEKVKMILLSITIVNMGRVWMVSTCTFKVTESNRRQDGDKERERKRAVEIKAALEKRRQRALRRQGRLC